MTDEPSSDAVGDPAGDRDWGLPADGAAGRIISIWIARTVWTDAC